MALTSEWSLSKAGVKALVVEDALGLKDAEPPPPIALTLVAAAAACMGRPSLS